MPSGGVPILTSSAAWHVAHTELHTEHLAFNSVSEEGFRAFLPRVISRTKGNAQRILPFFPRYLFVFFDDRDPWGKILRCRGVSRLISFMPGIPARVPEREIERLMSLGRAGDGVIDDRAPEFPRLVPGQAVRVREGAFEGWHGVIERSGDERVRVLLALMGGPRSVEMKRSMVDAGIA